MSLKSVSRWLAIMAVIAAGLPGFSFADETETAKDDTDKKEAAAATAKDFKPTHKQVNVFKPMHEGEVIGLNTFCLDANGNILAAVGGSQRVMKVVKGRPTYTSVKQPTMLQVYSPDLELLKEFALEFNPTAVNVDNSGNIYVGGDAKIAKMSPDGKILAMVDSPTVSDMEQLKKDIAEELKTRAEQLSKTYTTQIDRLKKQLAKLEEKDEEDLSKTEQVRLQTIPAQIKTYERQIEMFADQYKVTPERVESMIQQKLAIKSIAVNEKDMYVTCAASKGYGYEIWRMSQELTEPEQVVASVSGCCGQMDIQAMGDQLMIAENTKFRVGIYDRDGEMVSNFGKRDRTGDEGFGSCCNPMNIRCCSNGDILTAESSIGTIKRFNKEGELVGLIGKAKIGGGCKHVALGHDEKRNRFYMMYEDEGAICVLLANEDAPAETEFEAEAKKAATGLGKQLLGKWSIVEEANADEQENVYSFYQYSSIEFKDDDAFAYEQAGNVRVVTAAGAEQPVSEWKPVKQCDESNCVTVSIVEDQVERMQYDVSFDDEDHITVKVQIGGRPLFTSKYERAK